MLLSPEINRILRCLPLCEVRRDGRDEAGHVEADLIHRAEGEARHDRDQREVHVEPRLLLEENPRNDHGEDRSRALDRLCETHGHVVQRD